MINLQLLLWFHEQRGNFVTIFIDRIWIDFRHLESKIGRIERSTTPWQKRTKGFLFPYGWTHELKRRACTVEKNRLRIPLSFFEILRNKHWSSCYVWCGLRSSHFNCDMACFILTATVKFVTFSDRICIENARFWSAEIWLDNSSYGLSFLTRSYECYWYRM